MVCAAMDPAEILFCGSEPPARADGSSRTIVEEPCVLVLCTELVGPVSVPYSTDAALQADG